MITESVILGDLRVFLGLFVVNTIGLLITFVQLLFAKPKSKKILIPIVLFTITTFAILIATDFYLEIKMTHITPKQNYTQTVSKEDEKKRKSRFKMGYFVIYGRKFNSFSRKLSKLHSDFSLHVRRHWLRLSCL